MEKETLDPRGATNVVNTLFNGLNTMGFDPKPYVNLMCRQHRTLQQSFTRLCFAWLKTVASDGYGYDGRNEASHLAAKAIQDAGLLDPPMPFI